MAIADSMKLSFNLSGGATDPLSDKPLRAIIGFTLLELMLAIVLIGILAGLSIPAFCAYRETARVAACIAELKIMEKRIALFRTDFGRLPDILNDVDLHKLKDPWGNPYRYTKIEGAPKSIRGTARKDRFLVPINSDYDLYSVGRDGQSKPPLTVPVSADDIIRANDGEFVGRASSY